eukprot:XP_001700524.1 predicted protein [Chlamydomonas reinhardtii]
MAWEVLAKKRCIILNRLNREPVPRGASFSKKLAFLEITLNKHGTELEQFFKPQGGDPNRGQPGARRPNKIPIPTLLALKQGPGDPPAEWRVRVHASRRRVLLVVKCVVLLMRGKLRVAPVPRLDRFDFAIYSSLGSEWLKVAEEQQRYMLLRDQVEAATVALQDAIQAATAPLPERSQTNTPPGLPGRGPLPLLGGLGPAGGASGVGSRNTSGPNSPQCNATGLPMLQMDGPPADAQPQPQPPCSPKPLVAPRAPAGGMAVLTVGGGGGGSGSSGGAGPGSGRDVSPIVNRGAAAAAAHAGAGPGGVGAAGGGRNHGVRSNLGGQAAMHAGRQQSQAVQAMLSSGAAANAAAVAAANATGSHQDVRMVPVWCPADVTPVRVTAAAAAAQAANAAAANAAGTGGPNSPLVTSVSVDAYVSEAVSVAGVSGRSSYLSAPVAHLDARMRPGPHTEPVVSLSSLGPGPAGSSSSGSGGAVVAPTTPTPITGGGVAMPPVRTSLFGNPLAAPASEDRRRSTTGGIAGAGAVGVGAAGSAVGAELSLSGGIVGATAPPSGASTASASAFLPVLPDSPSAASRRAAAPWASGSTTTSRSSLLPAGSASLALALAQGQSSPTSSDQLPKLTSRPSLAKSATVRSLAPGGLNSALVESLYAADPGTSLARRSAGAFSMDGRGALPGAGAGVGVGGLAADGDPAAAGGGMGGGGTGEATAGGGGIGSGVLARRCATYKALTPLDDMLLRARGSRSALSGPNMLQSGLTGANGSGGGASFSSVASGGNGGAPTGSVRPVAVSSMGLASGGLRSGGGSGRNSYTNLSTDGGPLPPTPSGGLTRATHNGIITPPITSVGEGSNVSGDGPTSGSFPGLNLAGAGGGGSAAHGPVYVSEEAAARIEVLKQQLQARLEDLHRCSQLISVFLNRCNAAWAEAQAWSAPAMVTQLQLAAFARSESGMVFKNELVHMLTTGTLAVHLRAADDFLEPGLARSWGQQAADAAAGAGAGAAGGGDAYPPGGRPAQLGSGGPGSPGSTAAAGVAAVAAGGTPMLMSYSSGRWPGRSQAPDLWTHDPWRMLETHRPGMVFSGARLDAVPLGCRYVANLVLAVEAAAGREAVARLPLVLVVSEDQQDEVVRQLWGFRFFGIRRENVVVVVQPSHPGYCYDSEHRTWNQGDASHSLPLGSGYGLMQLAWSGEAMGVGEDGCLAPLPLSALDWMEARGVRWLVSRRARDLTLLHKDGVLDMNSLAYGLYFHTDRAPGTNIILEAQSSNNLLLSRALDSIIMSRRPEGGDGRAETPPTAAMQAQAQAQAQADPAAPNATASGGSGGGRQQVVELCHTDLATPVMRAVLADCQAAGRVLTGVGRYMLHLPSIKQMLAGRLSVLRPKLGLVDDLLHLRLELADFTSAPAASSLLLQARPDSPQLLVHDDVDALLPLLQRIVVFVVSNSVSAAAVSMAASLARPGRDNVTIATVVSDAALFRDRAEALLAKHAAAFEKLCAAQYFCEVVDRASYGLIDCMENYATLHGATLVVMGSNSLTSGVTSSSVAASLSMMAVLEGQAKGLVDYLAGKLIHNTGGDQLFLSYIRTTANLTRQQQANVKALVSRYLHQVATQGMRPTQTLLLDAPMDRALAGAVSEHGIDILALPAGPRNSQVPPQVVATLRSAGCAVLWHRDATSGALTK